MVLVVRPDSADRRSFPCAHPGRHLHREPVRLAVVGPTRGPSVCIFFLFLFVVRGHATLWDSGGFRLLILGRNPRVLS